MARIIFVLTLLFSVLTIGSASFAQDQRVLATVNDIPITNFDVKSRLALWKLTGRDTTGPDAKRKALDSIIDDHARVGETEKSKNGPSKKEVADRLAGVAKGLGTDIAGLKAKLKTQGISLATLELQVKGQIAFSRLVFGKYKENVKVDPAEVDAKLEAIKADMRGQLNTMMAKIKSDPRLKPVTVMTLMEINFPVDPGAGAAYESLLQSRFVEMQQFSGRYKGCKSAKSAASGIFNVKIGKPVEADASKLPPQLKSAFEKAGTGKVIGPMRSEAGLQFMALCSKREIKPQIPKPPPLQFPSREQVENAVFNEKVAKLEGKYASKFRDSVIIEYRDQSLGQ